MKKKRLLLIAAVTIFCIIDIDCVIDGMLNGIHTCINSVVPALFVFMVLANIIISILLSEDTFSLPPKYIAFFIGNLCGFPIGALICERFCASKHITQKEAASILPFCNNTSPAFILGVIGISLFKNKQLGWILLASQILSSALPLFLIKINKKKKASSIDKITPCNDILFDAIESSIVQILKVCSIICVFTVITAFFDKFNLNQMSIILEISNGAAVCASLYNASPMLAFTLCGFCCGFSGICVHMQILSMVKHFHIDFYKLVISKAIQGVLCAVFSALGYYLFF